MRNDESIIVEEVRSIELRISDHYFRLTTEGIRLFSNQECRHVTLDEVVSSRAMLAGVIVETYEAEDLRNHLNLIPVDGGVPISLSLREQDARLIEDAIPLLEGAVGVPVRFGAVVSLLLFDWIVERHSTEIVMKLGLSAEDEKRYRRSYRRRRH